MTCLLYLLGYGAGSFLSVLERGRAGTASETVGLLPNPAEMLMIAGLPTFAIALSVVILGRLSLPLVALLLALGSLIPVDLAWDGGLPILVLATLALPLLGLVPGLFGRRGCSFDAWVAAGAHGAVLSLGMLTQTWLVEPSLAQSRIDAEARLVQLESMAPERLHEELSRVGARDISRLSEQDMALLEGSVGFSEASVARVRRIMNNRPAVAYAWREEVGVKREKPGLVYDGRDQGRGTDASLWLLPPGFGAEQAVIVSQGNMIVSKFGSLVAVLLALCLCHFGRERRKKVKAAA